MTRGQLIGLGYSPKAIKHRVARGRLHPFWPGVYAVGSPRVTQRRLWMGAVLYCGAGAALSHRDAAALWGIRPAAPGPVHVSVPAGRNPRGRGIVVHRRAGFEATVLDGIRVTTPVCTIVDIAAGLPPREIEIAVNQCDVTGLLIVPDLRAALDLVSHRPGLPRVRRVIDRHTYRFTRSGLERTFIPIAMRAGLPRPLTRQWVNGFEVDFYWPERRFVVETDGGTYHRTPAQQTADRRRDQAHTVAGLTALRFTHGQIRYEPGHVHEVLQAVATRPPS